MKNLTIIITMAGLGSRFRKAGYDCPKYMIEAKGKTLFEWSIDSLLDYLPHVNKVIFVVREEDDSHDFILEKCRLYNISNVQIIELQKLTDGQATTCLIAAKECNSNDSIMVYNIDTYVEPFELKYSEICGDGYLPCFHAEGDHWSFVRLENNKVAEIAEKVRISDICTLGAYYFSSANLYEKMYDDYYLNNSDKLNSSKTEKYIAPIYNYMVKKGMDVKISIIDRRKVHVLGTPEELNLFIGE